MHFRRAQVEAMLDLARGLHDVAQLDDPRGFVRALHRAIPCDYALLFLRLDPTTYRILPSTLTLSDGGNNDTAIIADYNAHFWQHKRPVIERLIRRELQEFDLSATPSLCLSRPQQREFVSDFWEKHKIRHSYARYLKTPQGWLGIYINREPGRPPFTDEEKGCLEMLAPHFRLVAEREHARWPCLFADGDGGVVCIEPDFEERLQGAGDLGARFRLQLPGWVREARNQSQPLHPYRVTLREQHRIWRFVIVPAGMRAPPMFRVSLAGCDEMAAIDPAVLQRLAGRYRLAPRERELVALAVAGLPTKEMARRLALATDTVKEYLGTLYRKVGVGGRAALVARVLGEQARNG